jgi:hypothetical protein
VQLWGCAKRTCLGGDQGRDPRNTSRSILVVRRRGSPVVRGLLVGLRLLVGLGLLIRAAVALA